MLWTSLACLLTTKVLKQVTFLLRRASEIVFMLIVEKRSDCPPKSAWFSLPPVSRLLPRHPRLLHALRVEIRKRLGQRSQ